MRISELITALERLKAEHGDALVLVPLDDDNGYRAMREPSACPDLYPDYSGWFYYMPANLQLPTNTVIVLRAGY